MSVTSQALIHAINHIESLMKQAATETKKAIDNSAFDENDYFVITLELTPLGFTSDVSIESDKFEVMCYHPNVVAIFVDQESKFLSWENPTESDIKAFKDMLVIKLEQAEKYDTLADNLAEPLQTRNISITDKDLEQSTLAFLEKHGIDSETFVETLADNLSFNKDSIFKEANVRYFRGFIEQPFKHLATASSDDGRLMLNDVFESKGIRFSFETLEPAPADASDDNNTPATKKERPMSAIDRKITITPEQLAQIESSKPTATYYKALEIPSPEQSKTFSKGRFDAYFE